MLALYAPPEDSGGSTPQQTAEVEIIPRNDDAPPQRSLPAEDGGYKVDIPDTIEDLRECEFDYWYGGIGVSVDPGTGVILEVYRGYPADRAGLKAGDRILPESEALGEPGTVAVLRIETLEKQLLTLEVTREKICIFK